MVTNPHVIVICDVTIIRGFGVSFIDAFTSNDAYAGHFIVDKCFTSFQLHFVHVVSLLCFEILPTRFNMLIRIYVRMIHFIPQGKKCCY